MNGAAIGIFVNSFVGRPGNIGARLLPVARALAESGAEVDVYARGGVEAPGSRLFGMGLLGHAPRLLSAYRGYVQRSFPHRAWDIALYDGFTLPRLRRFWRAGGRYAVAHVAEMSPKLIRTLKANGTPVVLDMAIAPIAYVERRRAEDSGFPLEPLTYMSQREKDCLALAQQVLAPSPFVADEIRRLGVPDERISIVPFGVAVDDWTRAEPKPADAPLDFCFAGNIGVRKGVLDLLEAWRDPRLRRHRLHLCGRMYPEVRQVLDRSGFDNVITPGFVDTGEYFKACDVFVLPSLMEGSAKSVYEAMNRGMPVITTYESGAVIADGVEGYLAPTLAPQALADRMAALAADPAVVWRMGQAAKATVRRYTWARYVEGVTAAYDRLGALA